MEKQTAKTIYFRIGRVWCPALNDYVSFSSKGFRHLVRKQGLARSPAEQSRRFSLIPYAKEIVANSDSIVRHRIEKSNRIIYTHDSKQRKAVQIDFWSLKMDRDGKTITVVIRQSSGGIKHFLSIF